MPNRTPKRAMLSIVAVSCSLLVAGACQNGSDGLVDGVFTQAEWEVVNTLSPLPPPPPVKSNRVADDPKAAALGQALFFDRGFSGPILVGNSDLGPLGATQKVNCTACHGTTAAFADDRSQVETSTGAGFIAGRNTLGLTNLNFYEWSGWQGFIDTMWGHAILAGPECGPCLNSSRLAVARRLYEKYRTQYEEIFPTTPLDPDLDPAVPDEADGGRRFPLLTPSQYPLGKPSAPSGGVWVKIAPADQEKLNVITANYGKVVEAYLRKLGSNQSPFDKYVAGDATAISDSAKRGLKLFVGKAACVECHSGPSFSDNKFHNDGVPERLLADGGMRADLGRFDGITAVTGRNKIWSSDGPYSDEKSGIVDALFAAGAGKAPDGGFASPEEERGKFRTKGLRSVAKTAPYMHTGAIKTLEEVVRLYNQGGGAAGSFVGARSSLLVPLNLSDQEIADLVAFLQSLTGEEPPAELLQDTSAAP